MSSSLDEKGQSKRLQIRTVTSESYLFICHCQPNTQQLFVLVI